MSGAATVESGAVGRALRRSLQIGAVLLLAALIGLFANTLRNNDTTVSSELRDGKSPAAPDFTLQRINGGGDLSLAKLRGRIVLVNFWASWCDPCKDEAPILNALASRYGRRVAVVGVDTQDFKHDAARFARTYHLSYPLVHDTSGDVSQAWGVGLLPETFVVDAAGHVRHYFDGEVTSDGVARELRTLMREPAA